MTKRWVNSFNFWLVLIILVGGSLRFGAIGAKAIWLDEAFSIWVAKQSVPEIGQWLIQIDQHPPLYYVLLHYWIGTFGDLQGAVRAFSALCGTLAIAIFYAAGKELYDARVGLIAALLLAVAPFHVRFAQEARMYALLTLAVAAALYFLAHILKLSSAREHGFSLTGTAAEKTMFSSQPQHRNPQAGIWRWIGLAVAQAAIMLTHNTAAVYFPLALNLAVFVLWRLHNSDHEASPGLISIHTNGFIRKWLLFQLMALLLWSTWAWAFVVQARGVDGEFWISPPTLDSILATLHTLFLAHLPRWFPFYPLADLLFWGLAAYGVYTQRQRPGRALLLIVLFATPIIVSLLVSLRRPIFYDRTLIWVTLPLYLLIAAGVEQIGQKMETVMQPQQSQRVRGLLGTAGGRTRQLQLLSIGIILILSGFALISYYLFFEKEEWDRAAAYLAEQAQPGDMIIFNATWVQLPFAYYFRHYDTDVELRGLPVDLFDRGILEPKMAEEDLPYMRQLIADQSRVWLVYSHEWYTDPERIVVRELQRVMTNENRQRFEGLQVLEFTK